MGDGRTFRLSGTIEDSSDPDLVGRTWSTAVQFDWPPNGVVAFGTPAGWRLFLDAGRTHLQRADAQRVLLPDGLVVARSPSPFPVRMWRDPEPLHAFIRNAAAGIVLCHTALDNWSADLIPEDFTLEVNGQSRSRKALVALGLERRITQVAAGWSGRPNLRTENEALVAAAMRLKTLRDDLEHVNQTTIYRASGHANSIYARLLNEPRLEDLANAADDVIAHYSVNS